jgi:hypothetical protein
MDFIGRFYCFFEKLFGESLGEYLWGFNCGDQDYTNPVLFPRLALATLVISILVAILYYYVVNNTRLSRWWHWFIVLLVNSTICFFYAYWWIKEDSLNHLIGDCMLYERDEAGNVIAELITESNFWGLSLTNAIVAAIMFFVISICIKWKSSACRNTPF